MACTRSTSFASATGVISQAFRAASSGSRSMNSVAIRPASAPAASWIGQNCVARATGSRCSVGAHGFQTQERGCHPARFRTDSIMDSAKFLRDGDRLHILHRGATIAVRDLTLAAPEPAAAAGGDGRVRAAMNGRVVAVLVKPGEQVVLGQPVMTLEAMKMEHVH